MFTLRCTQKLLCRGLTDAGGTGRTPTTVLGDWYAHVLVTRPHHLVLCVSERTLLPVVVLAKAADRLPSRLVESLVPVLQRVGVEDAAVQYELAEMGACSVGRTASRSVVGSMNEVLFFLQISLDRHPQYSLLEHAMYLARIPLKGCEGNYPDRATIALFQSAALLGRVRDASAL